MRSKFLPKESSSYSTGGLGFCSVLTIIFVVLKLVGVINWSWVWVLSPIWISWLLFGLIIVIVVAASVAMWCWEDRKWK